MSIVFSPIVGETDRGSVQLFNEQVKAAVPSGPITFVGSVAEQDALCQRAGLTGGFAAVMAAIQSTGKWPPDICQPCVDPSGRPMPNHWFGPRADPMLIRAWAKMHAPSLIDPAVTQPPTWVEASRGWW